MNIILNAWFLGAGVALATCSTEGLQRFESSQPHMGTKFTIVLYAPDHQLANRAFDSAFSRIAQLDEHCSDYNELSELSRLSSSSPHDQPQSVSEDLFRLLQRAQEISLASQGAFDITVGPLTKLWRRAHRKRELPAKNRLAEATAAVGYRLMKLDAEKRTVQLTRSGMRLDLGGIAKGYAVDQALAEIRKLGMPIALINASGDMVAGDAPPGQPGWRVGIAPLEPGAPPSVFGFLANQAMATSGDAFQFVEIDGIRYSHIVDPRTGLGLTDRSSASVLATDGTTADAMASAVSVLGREKGMELIARTGGVEALLVTQSDAGVQATKSRGFAQWILDSQKKINHQQRPGLETHDKDSPRCHLK
jgi:thiamine biosynthesis lipoprotein